MNYPVLYKTKYSSNRLRSLLTFLLRVREVLSREWVISLRFFCGFPQSILTTDRAVFQTEPTKFKLIIH